MALVALQTIFQDAFPAYEQTHPLPAHVRKAAWAIMQCRTAALGGHVQACPDGHVARVWYHSCRHRSCPQYAYLQTENQPLGRPPHVHCLVTGGGRTPAWTWGVGPARADAAAAVRQPLEPHALGRKEESVK